MAAQTPTQPMNAETGEPSLTASIEGLVGSPIMHSNPPLNPTQNHPPQQTLSVAPSSTNENRHPTSVLNHPPLTSPPSPSTDHLLPESEPIRTPVNTAQGTNQPDAPVSLIYIPISEGKHKPAVSPAGQPIHIPRYLKSNRRVDWNCAPPSSVNSRFVGDTGVNTLNLPARPVGGVNPLASPKSGTPPAIAVGVNSPRSLGGVNGPSVNASNLPARPMGGVTPLASNPPATVVSVNSPSLRSPTQPQPAGVNSPQAGVHSHWAPAEQQTNNSQPPPLTETGDIVTKAPPSGNENSGMGGGLNGHPRIGVTYPSNGQQPPVAPEQGVGSPQFGDGQGLQQTQQGLQQTQEGLQHPQQGLQQPPPLAVPQQQGVYAVAGAPPNLPFPPLMGTTPAGQAVQINFGPQAHAAAQHYAPQAPMRRPPNMIGDVPKAKDAVKRRERERVRRAIMANIISGLRNYGGYNLPSSAADIEYIRALLREAGYVTEVDGTTYRTGVAPPVGGEHPPEAATSSREDYGTAQDTPPSTAAYAGSHGFASVQPGQAPGTNGSQEQEAGGSQPPGDSQPTQAEVSPGAANRAADSVDDMMLDGSEIGPGKRLLGFAEGGSEPKKLKPS